MGKKRFQYLYTAAAALILLLFVGCSALPTTVVLHVSYPYDNLPSLPAAPFLYYRVMLTDGTVIASNEAAPRDILAETTAGTSSFQFLLLPTDAILTDPANLYMIDAYIYDTNLVVPPINPTNGGDAQRFTREAVLDAAALPGDPIYYPSGNLQVNVRINPGDQKNIYLNLLPDFP